MAEGDGATIDIAALKNPFFADLVLGGQSLDHSEGLSGKGLVQFKEIHVRKFKTGKFEGGGGRRHRT
ncbi:MAG: hypothetical protein DDT34_02024 [Firmicutes bacterium]|nr:hypothetical protein [Bacillota bacterium]